MRTCEHEGCDRVYSARGYCTRHYNWRKRKGLIPPAPTREERFWAKVDKREDDECWPWLASTTIHGYGRFGHQTLKAGYTTAHRASYELNVGEIPEGMVVRHKCHNRICVNPAHLEVGSYRDNSRDTTRAGRVNTQKLTDDDVMEIRRRALDESYRSLAREFGVTDRAIKLAATGATFRHLPHWAAPCPTCGRAWD